MNDQDEAEDVVVEYIEETVVMTEADWEKARVLANSRSNARKKKHFNNLPPIVRTRIRARKNKRKRKRNRRG